MDGWMDDYLSIYCMYFWFHYAYIDINAFLASQVWSQSVAGARTYGSTTISIRPPKQFMYVCIYVCV